MRLAKRLKKWFLGDDTQPPQRDTEVVEERNNMIEGIDELAETTVKEVMVPRIDVQFVADTVTLTELQAIIAEQGYSRYPVYTDTIDNVIGILYVKDILRQQREDDSFDVRTCMRKPYFVPETIRLDKLLREFKKRRVHIAVAIDEYGGVSGIVSMEDILEVIVGEIQDEFDDEDDDIIEMGEGIFLCDARTSIDEINERLDLDLPEDDFETLGGFVFEQFGRIPLNQEKVTFHEMDFVVQEIEGHKINRVKIVTKRV